MTIDTIEVHYVDDTRWDVLVNGGCQGQYVTLARAKAAARKFARTRDRVAWIHLKTGAYRLVRGSA